MLRENLVNAGLPPRQSVVIIDPIGIRDADIPGHPNYSKSVEVGVEPTHGILNGNMKVPERIFQWYLDSPPDRRLDKEQFNAELDNHRRLVHFMVLCGLASLSMRRVIELLERIIRAATPSLENAAFLILPHGESGRF